MGHALLFVFAVIVAQIAVRSTEMDATEGVVVIATASVAVGPGAVVGWVHCVED